MAAPAPVDEAITAPPSTSYSHEQQALDYIRELGQATSVSANASAHPPQATQP